MSIVALSNGLESVNGVLPISGLCEPNGGLLETNASPPVSRVRQPMATEAGGNIICEQLDGTICRLKSASCDSGERRLTAL